MGRPVFTRDRMNSLCANLSSAFINPHKHLFGGDYDVNVLIYALEAECCSARWHDRRRPFAIAPRKDGLELVGFLINRFKKETVLHKVLRISPRHWIAVKRRGDLYQVMDSQEEDYQIFKREETEKRIIEMLGEFHDAERRTEVIEVYSRDS